MDFKALFVPRLYSRRVLTKTWRIMRLTALILFVACLHVNARSYSQTVTLTERNASLQHIFKSIHQQTGYQFFYEDALLDKAGKVTIIVKNLPVDEVLAECLKDLPIIFSMVNKTIVISAQSTVSFTGKDVPLEQVFAAVKKQTGYTFVYYIEALQAAHRVTIDVKGMTVDEFLEVCLKDQPLTYKVIGQTVMIAKKEEKSINAGNGGSPGSEIKGRITNEKGEPLSGASVQVKGTKKGTNTAPDGTFILKGINQGQILIVSYTGFAQQEVKVGDISNLVLVLKPSNNPLDEAQVIAYGQTTQRLNVGNVTEVKADEIEKQPVANPLLALEGQVPGLVVSQTTGMPGGAVNVQIQGQNSISNGNSPFYVVDGVPYMFSLPSNLDGVINGGSPFSYINPSDIESISVLKDADATAIYGSRAANGAILITTKKGKVGPAKVDFNLQQGWGAVNNRFKLLNTPEYLEMRHEALANDGLPGPSATDYDINGFWDSTRYTNWQKVLIGNNAEYTNLNGSVSGGSINTQYLVGATYHRETTVFPGSFADQKGNIHFSLNSSTNDQRFHFSFSGNYMIDNNQIPNVDLTGTAVSLAPDAPRLFNADGTLNWDQNSAGISTWGNPLAQNYNTYSNKTNNLVSNMILGYQLFPGLEISSSFGYTNLQASEITLLPITAAAPETRATAQRVASYGTTGVNSWIIEPKASYQKSIGGGKLNVLIGSTIQQLFTDYSAVAGVGYNSDAVMKNILAATNLYPAGSKQSVYKYNAGFSRVTYNLLEKYIIDFNGRRDGSSRFGADNQFHNFWSIGAGWIFSQESFVKGNQSFLSFGKLKVSYGTTGNDQIGDYSFLSLYSPVTGQVPYQNASGLAPNGLTNPYLAWEETRKWNNGLDLGFFHDRLLLDMNYYRNRTSNQLLASQLPTITGFSSVTANLPATVQNSGLEMIITSVNIRTKVFSWSTRFNLTPWVQNKLISFPDLAQSTYAGNLFIGKPASVVNVFHYLGVDPTQGVYMVADSKGSPTTTPNFATDRTVHLNTSPTVYGGMENSFVYKDFGLSFSVQYVKQIASNLRFGYLPGSFNSNQPVTVLDRWRKPGDIARIQQFDANYSFVGTFLNAIQSDAAYLGGSYMRFKNISLSWQLPAHLQRKAGMHNTSIFVQGQNLWTISQYKGLDSETQSTASLPPLRTVTFGLKMGL
jgi:TonB-linked SusC/RagA family outer membrane protein